MEIKDVWHCHLKSITSSKVLHLSHGPVRLILSIASFAAHYREQSGFVRLHIEVSELTVVLQVS